MVVAETYIRISTICYVCNRHSNIWVLIVILINFFCKQYMPSRFVHNVQTTTWLHYVEYRYTDHIHNWYIRRYTGNAHYSDVIMGPMVSQITNLMIVNSIAYLGADQRNIKVPSHWPLWGHFTGHRWIPHTKGHWRWKCFHLMTSSWVFPDHFMIKNGT